jgi:hypothetical protein
MEEAKKSVLDSLKTLMPVNLNVWIIVLTCLVVIIALSRLMTLQKTVSDLSSRPAVDEHVVRGIVRQHLEETVKAMDQQNRLQIQMRHQQMEQARRQAQPPPPPPHTIEIIEPHPVFERKPETPKEQVAEKVEVAAVVEKPVVEKPETPKVAEVPAEVVPVVPAVAEKKEKTPKEKKEKDEEKQQRSKKRLTV